MLAFQHTATVLKELPRSTGIHSRNQGTDTHFSLQEDLALLKAHWHNFTTGTAKENANPINDRAPVMLYISARARLTLSSLILP